MADLDQQHERIQDDLRGLIAGDVRCDDVFLQVYSCDSSIYEIRPLGVVCPRSARDVAACVQYALQKQIPIHARGAGTGVAGESLGSGLVLDFSKYLRRILRTDANSVRVQAGAVQERLNSHLARYGRVFGPDPGAHATTTLGGVIGIDGAGSHWLKYGSARRHVLSLQVVTATGDVFEVGREALDGGRSSAANPRKRQLVEQLYHLLTQHKELIQGAQDESLPNRCGYNLRDVASEGHLDLARLLVGSEGTLALITEAHLATQPLPAYRGVTLLLFDSLEKATQAVGEILPHGPTACDLMDRRHLTLARESEVRFDVLLPRETEAALLVEFDGEEQHEVRDRLHQLVDQIWHQGRMAFGARQAFDAAEIDLFWNLVGKIQPSLYRLKGPSRPVPAVEDMAVPPEALSGFLVSVQNVLKKHEVTASLFCHAGQGQLHVHPILDLTDPKAADTIRRLADELYAKVFEVGGTISAEHACGICRTPFVERQCGPLYDVFRQIKRIFDPDDILNPGRVIGDDPGLLTKHLRSIIPSPSAGDTPDGEPEDSSDLRDQLELQLNWDPSQVADVVRMCNGCGDCRSLASDVRMCPIFRTQPAEEASPRAKANLIRGVLTGRLELGTLSGDEFKAVADLCVHCHMCSLECPALVDVPKLMLEGKGAYVAANGLDHGDWVMSRLDLLAALGSRFSRLTNLALGNRRMRWLMERTMGIARGRKLPRLASRSFVRRIARRRLTHPRRHSGNKVAYMVDTFADYCDTQLADATVRVLEHNGVSVFVPPDQKQAGMAAISCGDLDYARILARQNVAIFAEAVRQGYHVVASEPAVALCFGREYPNLIDDADAKLVAENTSEVCTYLWRMHIEGKLRLDLKPINASLGYHMPCRLKALEVGSPGENLLGLIPGLSIIHVEEGCSGMAGTFGLRRGNYRTSLRAGRKLTRRLRRADIQVGTTECSTCRIQMEQGTNKPSIHPIKLLALAYSLMPEVESLLTAPTRELTLT
jgi:FAD/FMN-containing dehydrogenase/Fe-S oxidoreductase